MDNLQKPPQSDAKRLQTIIEILQVSPHSLSKILEYKAPSTIYHVINGINKLSPLMINSIIEKFPRVNYLYLKTGKGEPLLQTDSEVQAQQNLFGHIISEKKRSEAQEPESTSENEHKEKASPRSTYMVNQLQSLIENSNETNRLMRQLIDETKKVQEALLHKA